MKQTFADILSETGREMEKKVAAKIPGWEGMEIPSTLSLEQCSSSATSSYKARFVHGRVADLTGGLGVDSYAFSKNAVAVWYNEMKPGLFEAAGRNFAKLGATGIVTNNHSVKAEGGRWLDELRQFRPDIIYLDPARRDSAGRKVFLLEDCSPDIVGLLPLLLETAPEVMVKISPMADISMVASRFGGHLRELHIVGTDGECKELLCRLDRAEGGFGIVATDLQDEFSFTPDEERECPAEFAQRPLEYLYEPGAVLMKAGAFKLVGKRYGAARLDPFTHLYFTSSPSLPLGRCHSVVEVLPLNKESLRTLGRLYPEAEVSSRNLPMTSEELRKRLGVRPSNRIHIFGCSFKGSKVLVVTEAQPAYL